MRTRNRILSGLAAGIALAAGAGVAAQGPPPQAPPPPCSTATGEFVCGLVAPEDLVAVPGGQWVVAGAYSGSGGIYLIRASDKTAVVAYPSPTASDRFDAKTYAGCPGPPDAAAKAKYQTHGLSLMPGRNGVHRLMAVLHGPRESVEVFELDARKGTPTLTWIGCAVAPEPVGLNSVRWLDDGGFIATNFLPRNAGPEGMKRLRSGEKNGELWEWHTATGWQKVPGSESSGANGIEISPDGRWIYVAAWGSQSFYRLSRNQTPPVRTEVPLGFAVDNIRWAADGTILAAGQAFPGAASIVVKIDPQTLGVREVVRHANTPAFGNGTVAVEVGKEFWIGSFRGDRIATVPLPK